MTEARGTKMALMKFGSILPVWISQRSSCHMIFWNIRSSGESV